MPERIAPPLVLLSGWGIDKRIWQTLDSDWPTTLNHCRVNWPGYGESPALPENATIEQLADVMADQLPADALWVGWSLGGLLAGALLDHLPAPHRLIILGVGDRFCSNAGVNEAELTRFHRAFEHNPIMAWRHFLRWQAQGEPLSYHAHRQLQALLANRPNADNRTLLQGLNWLAHIDNSERFTQAPCPIIRIAGEYDPLIDPKDRDRATVITDAGHCPMLSQPAQLARLLTDHTALNKSTLR